MSYVVLVHTLHREHRYVLAVLLVPLPPPVTPPLAGRALLVQFLLLVPLAAPSALPVITSLVVDRVNVLLAPRDSSVVAQEILDVPFVLMEQLLPSQALHHVPLVPPVVIIVPRVDQTVLFVH